MTTKIFPFKINVFYSALLLLLLLACKDKQTTTIQEDVLSKENATERTYVKVIELKTQEFSKELISNGKLKAQNRCILRFSSVGDIAKLNVKNGSWVKSGDIIATQNDKVVRLQWENAKIEMEKAELALQDHLLSFGLQVDDTASISAKLMKIAKIRSGWNSSELALQKAQLNLDNCMLRAPFSGKIANLYHNEYEYVGGDEFCQLINDAVLNVDFYILETELNHLYVNQDINVSPFIDLKKRHKGKIISINPVVNSDGQIMVRAQINNPGDLVDGMNVKVFVENTISEKWVVPKSAVLIRGDNSEVVFRANPDGTALWTYINVVMENSREYVIEPDASKNVVFKQGDLVIVSENLNLANGSPIEIINQE